MALVLSKIFMRQISQTHAEDQIGISLWTVAEIEKEQAKQRALDAEAAAATAGAGGNADAAPMDIDDDEYGYGGLDDRALADVDLDV